MVDILIGLKSMLVGLKFMSFVFTLGFSLRVPFSIIFFFFFFFFFFVAEIQNISVPDLSPFPPFPNQPIHIFLSLFNPPRV